MLIRFPPPPLSNSLNDNELLNGSTDMAASGQRRPDAAGRPLSLTGTNQSTPLPPAVARIADAWPHLPPHIQDAMGTLIDASGYCQVAQVVPRQRSLTRETAWQVAQQCRSIVQSCLREEEWGVADSFGVL
jgi:hypothetical protein